MNDWTSSTLGDVGEVLIGLTYSPSQVGKAHGTLVLRSSNIQDGQLALDDTVHVSASIPDKIRVRASDILICVRNGSRPLIGKSLYLDERVEGETFGAFMAVFRSPMNDFLRYFFQSDEFKRQVGEHLGATINQITNRSLKSFSVVYPEKNERKKIVRQLMDVDDLIASLRALIAKKRAIKQGIMQELLTGRTRLPGFSGKWLPRSLSSLGAFLRGQGIKRDEVRSSGVACIRYGELYTTYTNYTASTVSFVSESIAAGALPLRSGDILFAGSGETKEEIGTNVAYIGGATAVAGGDIIVLRGTDYDPVYLSSLLNTPRVANQKARGGQGDAVVHINWRVLAALEVTIPLLSEQRAIARVLSDADAEIEALECRLETTRAIKQGMMQELLTGCTRLVPMEAVE